MCITLRDNLVCIFRWILYSVFLGKLNFGSPRIRITLYFQHNIDLRVINRQLFTKYFEKHIIRALFSVLYNYVHMFAG